MFNKTLEYNIIEYNESEMWYISVTGGAYYFIGKGGIKFSIGTLLKGKVWIKSIAEAKRIIMRLSGKCIIIGGE